MKSNLTKAILFLVQPKFVLLCFAISLLFYMGYKEGKIQEVAGCYDCGYESRQAFYLVIASAALLINRVWSSVISLLGSLKVIYSLGYWTFWNDLDGEVEGTWKVLNESIKWAYEYRPQFFVALIVASIVCFYAISSLRRFRTYPSLR